MMTIATHVLGPADRIECRERRAEIQGSAVGAVLMLAGVEVFATLGQFAAIRDEIDRMLAGEGPPPDGPAERERLEREALDRECRESSH